MNAVKCFIQLPPNNSRFAPISLEIEIVWVLFEFCFYILFSKEIGAAKAEKPIYFPIQFLVSLILCRVQSLEEKMGQPDARRVQKTKCVRTEHLMFNKMVLNLGAIKRFSEGFDFKLETEKRIFFSADVTFQQKENKNTQDIKKWRSPCLFHTSFIRGVYSFDWQID